MDFLLKSKSKWRIQDGRWFQFLIYIIDNVIMISPLVLKIMNVSANFLRHLSFYSKEPKSVTAFDLFTFFRTDLIQPEACLKLSSTSDWLMSA